MNRLLPISTVLLLLAAPVWGQDYPKVEVFGGFFFGGIEATAPVTGAGGLRQALGFQAAVALNITEAFGVVGEAGGLWGDLPSFTGGSLGLAEGTFRTLPIFAGPRFTKRMEGVTVFAHALPGFAQQRETLMRRTQFILPDSTTTSTSNGFALALGGGIDVKAGQHLAIRAVQIDYLYLPDLSRVTGRTNNFRLGIGVVWQFGGL